MIKENIECRITNVEVKKQKTSTFDIPCSIFDIRRFIKGD